jgi:hypothetical protein
MCTTGTATPKNYTQSATAVHLVRSGRNRCDQASRMAKVPYKGPVSSSCPGNAVQIALLPAAAFLRQPALCVLQRPSSGPETVPVNPMLGKYDTTVKFPVIPVAAAALPNGKVRRMNSHTGCLYPCSHSVSGGCCGPEESVASGPQIVALQLDSNKNC